MNAVTGTLLLALCHVVLPVARAAHAASPVPQGTVVLHPATWSTTDAQHAQGLPDARAKDKGSLRLTETELIFTGKASHAAIPRSAVTAVSAGNQRVEIWGVKGQILRAVIPNGGGVAAAMFMHHRVDMLTVEFVDEQGSYHAAMFFLPGQKAAAALDAFAQQAMVARTSQQNACADTFVRPKSLLIEMPDWDAAKVPPAYRALVYERLQERMRKVEGVDRVYRDGEQHPGQGCPAYTMRLTVSAFKEGSQVKRAILGPAGFFIGTTQMKFDATVKDADGAVRLQKQLSATTRGESESTGVTDNVAKALAKDYAHMLKAAAKADAVASSSATGAARVPAAGFAGVH